jgi:hypothetical protein
MHAKRLLSRLALLMLLAALLQAVACCRDSREESLLEDRFGDSGSGWGEESQDAFDRGYHQGEYFIEVYEPDWFVWANPGRRFTDVVAEVDARWVSGSPAGHFGLLCRYRAPGDFYYFAVTGDGYYAILRVEDGEAEVVTGDGFLPSPAVRTGEATNHIRAVCRGEDLALYVNGEELARATDDVLRRGDVGLGAGSGSERSIRVHFDNLVVTAAEEEE